MPGLMTASGDTSTLDPGGRDPIIERATELQRELGLEMGPEKRAQIKAYQLEGRAMGVVWNDVRESLGERGMARRGAARR